jgi:hypothetical protein
MFALNLERRKRSSRKRRLQLIPCIRAVRHRYLISPRRARVVQQAEMGQARVTKPAKLETGIEIRVPLFIKEGETIKVSTETREFAGRA